MTYSYGHVPQWTIELFAEDALPPGEREEVQAHLDRCAQCTAELETSRALFASLEALPRFAPSEGFAEAVMARVNLQPRESAAFARVRRWLPVTRRGWMTLFGFLLAPLAPLAALAAWLLSQPLVTAGGLLTMGERWAVEGWWWAMDNVSDLVVGSGILGWGEGVVESVWQNPTGEISLLAAFMALATPIAAYSLARLLRTPVGGVSHAN